MNINDLKQFAEAHFVDLRRVSTTDDIIHDQLSSGYLTKLSPAFALPVDQWRQFRPYQQNMLRNLAHGLGLKTSMLVLTSAARLHGLWVVEDKGIEVATLAGNQPARSRWGERTYYGMRMQQKHRGEFLGINATNAARTCVDIARIHGFVAGLAAMDSFLNARMNRFWLSTTLEEMARLKGMRTARDCFKYADKRSGSAWESVARAYLIHAGLDHNLEIQKRVGPYFADLCLEGWLIIEVDGHEKYDGTYGDPVQNIAKEREREKELTNAGYRVLRYGPQKLRTPERLINEVQRELERGPRFVPGAA